MRFTEDGPSIPDELLIARDLGRVVFFCGAGVSFYKAELPNFIQLAEMVIDKLGVIPKSPIRKVIKEIKEIENRTSVSGLISVDRIFGLLEKEFDIKDIEFEVASILNSENADLSAHQILIDISTTEEGITRLVTTNFDRLFNDCDKNLKSWIPPRLPDLSNPKEMNGIVYLHGKANSKYNGAEGDGFVLSSSEFGRAYLSDGWATSFIKEIINKYYLVFIGYSADDPPVQYLLEALGRNKNDYKNIYAFQSGNLEEASSKWEHRGVKSIPYENGHSTLWETLKEWAIRAKDIDGWYTKTISMAKKGPKSLLPFERGQIAHIVSTVYGIKKLIECKLPAEWLCVFDSSRRYANPGYKGNSYKQGIYVDPFNEYGIDTDIPPPKIDPDDLNTQREIPENTWDAFDINEFDKRIVEVKDLASITNISMSLPVRLSYIGVWIRNISNQPAALWWAAHQNNLHPFIKNQIQIENYLKESEKDIRKLWNYLFESWEHNKDYNHKWFLLKREIDKDGWSRDTVKKYKVNTYPYKSIYTIGPTPPDSIEELNDILYFNIKYPENIYDIEIPDEWLYEIVKVFRRNIELAKKLETEIGREYVLSDISTLYRDNSSEYFDLSRIVEEFSELFDRLIKIDLRMAKQEFSIWENDENIFCRIKIWVAGKKEIVDEKSFFETINRISDDAFWNFYHQRDLLQTIKYRWSDLNSEIRHAIEDRILKGPPKWDNEKKEHYEERKVDSILNRINWLLENSCELTTETKKENKRLIEKNLEWKKEYANHAADSHEVVCGFVQMDTEYSALLTCPIEKIIEKAEEIKKEVNSILIRRNPFGGLSKKEPEIALKALKAANKKGVFSEWAWRTFLKTDYREEDRAEFTVSIAELILLLSTEELKFLIIDVMYWFKQSIKSILTQDESCFDRLSEKLLDFMNNYPDKCKSSLVKREPDLIMESINSPTGIFSQALFNDFRLDDLENGDLVSPGWLKKIENLLYLPYGIRKYSVVILSSKLNWFYSKIPEWTENYLLAILESEDKEMKDAFMEGVLWGVKIPCHKLYLRLKPHYIDILKNHNIKKRYFVGVLAAIFLSGWISEKIVSDEEFREILIFTDDDFRSHIIWQFGKWTESNNSNKLLKLKEFFDNVWPRQKYLKSTRTSDSLCRLILTDNILFEELFEKVICLLSELDSNSGLFNLKLEDDNNGIIDLFPERVLTLLYKVLPSDTTKWPYNFDEILLSIGNADSSLKKDEKFIELKRKWDSQDKGVKSAFDT